MRMLGTRVHLELFDHGVTQGTFWQHALNGFFNRTTRETLLHFPEVCFVDAARIARVTEVFFVFRFGACYNDISCVNNDDVIAGVNVRGKFRFMFTAQTACNFAGYTTKDFAFCINNIPVTFDFMELGHNGLQAVFLKFEFEADHYRAPQFHTRKADKKGAVDRNPTVYLICLNVINKGNKQKCTKDTMTVNYPATVQKHR